MAILRQIPIHTETPKTANAGHARDTQPCVQDAPKIAQDALLEARQTTLPDITGDRIKPLKIQEKNENPLQKQGVEMVPRCGLVPQTN